MKKGKFFFILLILFLFACKNTNSSKTMTGIYFGSWHQTIYKFQFYKRGDFKFTTNGHFGNVSWNGKYTRSNDSLFLTVSDTSINTWGVLNYLYLIESDSCIIDYTTRYDYCKGDGEWHGSRKRTFKYPQISTSDTSIISDVEYLLQDALISPEVLENIKDTLSNLVVLSYHEINENYIHNLSLFGLPVLIKSSKEIKEENIENYILIDDINYNSNYSNIWLRIQPDFKQILANYKIQNGQWVRY